MIYPGIIGVGFVGDAIKHGLESFGFKPALYDPFKIPSSKLIDIINTDLVFICLPTPMDKNGDIDASIIDSIFHDLSLIQYKGVVVIKSTLRPDKGIELRNKYSSLRIIANPEYLTERTARQDFINSKWVVIGGNPIDLEPLLSLYGNIFPTIDQTVTSFEIALLVKYISNVLFATKVSLMNEFYQISMKLGMSWPDVVKALIDPRIGSMHLQVPGPDGKFGFGGNCFIKDINAMIKLTEILGTPNNVMNGAWDTNKIIRN